ncbi:siderophore-interacting protein [Brevibacterium aurantiacum]|uniref:Siderophore-interacting protein n=1 Tax=Brevibacterium aurantiacum TaxID=273384 RepID=A0A556CB07_BREAU|nr:siderophore-interacting protein [Brevibacterium aurantiacum]TSI14496.1 siderophore-interacting protein [Brevibacterium aurantiacum]
MPKTSREVSVHPLSLRCAEVSRIVDVTPGMRRITLNGPQLGAFESDNGFPQPGFVSPGFDDDIRLFFTAPGETEPVLPIQCDGYTERPKDPAATGRVYSVRHWDPDRGEIDIDFVKHGTGVATTWAYRAQIGDSIHFVGPRLSRALPASADWLLVAGDDTALPAIGRLLEELGEDSRAKVFIEIAEDAHRQHLRELPSVEITWLLRDGAPAGSTPLLLDAVRSSRWPEGHAFAWVAGEQSIVRDIRRHLVEDRGMAKEDIEFTGYWRRSEVVALPSDEALPDPERTTTVFERFHDLVELIPPIAIRVAVELGIGDLISRGIADVPSLAASSGSDERALGKLLRYLQTIDLLSETEANRYRLTEVGEFLTNDFWIDALSPMGALGRQSLGIIGLAESVRTGTASYSSVTGMEFAEVRNEQDYEDRLLERVAGFQPALAAPIAGSDLLDGVEHLVIHSGGAGAQAREFTAANPELRVTICALPAQANWLERDLPVSIPAESQRARIDVVVQSPFEPSPTADAVFIIRALGALPDADAAHALRQAAVNLGDSGRVYLLEDTFDLEDLDEHDAEADLLALTRHGSGLRTEVELAAVIAHAGLQKIATHTVGWGTTIIELTPKRYTDTEEERNNL